METQNSLYGGSLMIDERDDNLFHYGIKGMKWKNKKEKEKEDEEDVQRQKDFKYELYRQYGVKQAREKYIRSYLANETRKGNRQEEINEKTKSLGQKMMDRVEKIETSLGKTLNKKQLDKILKAFSTPFKKSNP